MPTLLTRLLERDPGQRTLDDYERAFDDFIRVAGGGRIEDLFDVPSNALNADYLVQAPQIDILIELKQIHRYESGQSVDAYFERLLRRGLIPRPTELSDTQVLIEPHSLTTSQWNHFYRKFRPNLAGHLDKAARQLKSTTGFLPNTDRRRVCGVVILNTGDFNAPVDLLHRLAEFHAKRKWRAGRFTHIDFVMCVMMDMVKSGQHPLHGRSLVRTAEDAPLVEGVRYLFDCWIRYGAASVGGEVAYFPGGHGHTPLELSGGITGKIIKTA